ncbi:MAG: ABC transporter ATP-binding protein [Ruminococcaceae bacterium]|nr:ABC transporter ATP-binding protein [Oscillospiraceae bacterium]
MVIIEFLKKHGWLYAVGLIFLALNSWVQTRAPEALGDAIDILSEPSPLWETLLRQALIIAAIGIGVFALRFIWRLCIIGNARRMEVFLREKLYLKLQELPVSFFRHQTSGDLMAYAINDVGAVRMTFGPVFAMGFNSITIAMLSIFGMIAEVELGMTLLALAPVPFAILATSLLGTSVQKKSLRVQKLFSGLSGFVGESISGVKVTKSFARETTREGQFNDISGEMRDANVDLAYTSALIHPLVTVFFGLSYALALIVGGNAVIDGTLSGGDLVTFLGYLTLVQQPVIQLGHIIQTVQRGLASYKRLNAIFKEPSIPEKEREIKKSIVERFRPDASARDLTFRYPDAEPGQGDALSGVSFRVKAGGTLGITGPTGCGKTTLLTILAKLQYVPDGMLSVGEWDINDIPAATLREFIGYVPQDGFLFSATIAENIALGSEIDMERVRECARLACIADEIEAFPKGYDTEVGERGTHLSGGQKQRVSLARALYRNPKLLLLDDTLSAVDNLTERRLIENLGLARERVGADSTIIIVSHRLSALEHCDEILHIEDGRVTERGTHAELVAMGGAYAETYRKQCEEANEGGER